MPAKNSIGQFHGRYPLINHELWKKYMESTGDAITYNEFKSIIAASMSEIQRWSLKEPIGFQMPNLGNIAVNRFKMDKDFRAYHNTEKGPIRNHNLHTGGDAFQIRWFHSSTSMKSRMPFWFFKANRTFNRTLASILKANNSPNYNSFMQDHFVTKELKQCKY
jgi:hypothetical protein